MVRYKLSRMDPAGVTSLCERVDEAYGNFPDPELIGEEVLRFFYEELHKEQEEERKAKALKIQKKINV